MDRHRPLLAQLLGVPTAAPSFLTALGLSGKPETLRLRVDPSLNLAAGLSDLTARVDELVTLEIAAKLAVIVENEITFLSVPVPAEGLVLWGKGFEVDRAGSMPWLADADIAYWGDLDTHGFAILNQLRAWLPQTRSVLMDRDTLLAHRDRWVTEATPTAARLSLAHRRRGSALPRPDHGPPRPTGPPRARAHRLGLGSRAAPVLTSPTAKRHPLIDDDRLRPSCWCSNITFMAR